MKYFYFTKSATTCSPAPSLLAYNSGLVPPRLHFHSTPSHPRTVYSRRTHPRPRIYRAQATFKPTEVPGRSSLPNTYPPSIPFACFAPPRQLACLVASTQPFLARQFLCSTRGPQQLSGIRKVRFNNSLDCLTCIPSAANRLPSALSFEHSIIFHVSNTALHNRSPRALARIGKTRLHASSALPLASPFFAPSSQWPSSSL